MWRSDLLIERVLAGCTYFPVEPSRSPIDAPKQSLFGNLEACVITSPSCMGCMGLHGASPDLKKHPTTRFCQASLFDLA
jgi:hypothetical protein